MYIYSFEWRGASVESRHFVVTDRSTREWAMNPERRLMNE